MSQAAHGGSEQIHERHSPPPVHHFQRDAHEQLQDEIVGDMDEAFVQKGVGEEAPSLVPSMRIVDEWRVERRGTREGEFAHGDAIVEIKADFHQTNEDDEERWGTASVILVVVLGRHRRNGAVEDSLGHIQLIHVEVVFVADQNHVAKFLDGNERGKRN